MSKFLRSETEGAFYALLVTGGLSIFILLSLVISFLPLYMHEIANLCRRSWSVLVAHLPAIGAAIPLLVLMSVLWRGGLSLLRHLRDTRRFLQSLPDRQREFPTRLQQLALDVGGTPPDIADHLDLIQDARPYSFCYGLLQPRICVTTGLLKLLDDAELRALLLHERHHLRQRDPLRILISGVLSDAMRVLPIVPALLQRYRVAQEVTADQAAIAGCDSDVPLSSALLKLLTAEGDPLTVPAVVGAFSATEERIARLVYGEEVARGVLSDVLSPSKGLSKGGLPLSDWLATLLIIAGTVLTSYAGVASMQVLSTFPAECVNTLAMLP